MELKFRAWHTKEKKMSMVFELGQEVIYDKNGEYLGLVYDDEFKIMQYTGLKDINGKEIYKCDIILHRNGNNYEVKYGEYIVKVNGGEYFNSNYGWYIGDDEEFEDFEQIYNENQIEVIGNIFENPKLLKNQKK